MRDVRRRERRRGRRGVRQRHRRPTGLRPRVRERSAGRGRRTRAVEMHRCRGLRDVLVLTRVGNRLVPRVVDDRHRVEARHQTVAGRELELEDLRRVTEIQVRCREGRDRTERVLQVHRRSTDLLPRVRQRPAT